MTFLHVLGDADTVRAFRLAGVAGTVVEAATDAASALDELLHAPAPAPHAAALVLLVTQQVAGAVRDRLDQAVATSGGPLVLEIPGVGEPLGTDPLHRVLSRALRSDL